MMGGHGHGGSGPGNLNEDVFGKAYDHHVVTRFLPYILPHKLLLAAAAVSMLALTASLVAGPWLIKLGIDGFIGRRASIHNGW